MGRRLTGWISCRLWGGFGSRIANLFSKAVCIKISHHVLRGNTHDRTVR